MFCDLSKNSSVLTIPSLPYRHESRTLNSTALNIKHQKRFSWQEQQKYSGREKTRQLDMRGSWYRVVHTVTTLRAAFQFSAGTRHFCVLWRVQTGSVAQPATYSMGTGGGGGGGTWSWPLASEQCWGYEWVELYLPSITRLNGVQRGNYIYYDETKA